MDAKHVGDLHETHLLLAGVAAVDEALAATTGRS
jgi:hypothetical protein